jgi:hypothetical protein
MRLRIATIAAVAPGRAIAFACQEHSSGFDIG